MSQLTAQERLEEDGEHRWILAGEGGAVECRGYQEDSVKFIVHPVRPLYEGHEVLASYCPVLNGPCYGFSAGINLAHGSRRRNEPWATLAALYEAKLAL